MKGRRGVSLAAAVCAVAGVLVIAGPAGASRQLHSAAATNVHCGDTINTSVTLNGDLDCSAYNGDALTIVTSGVTLDLGGHTITGNSSQYVVDADWTCGSGGNSRCDNVTVTNGTISGGDYQVAFGGDNNTAGSLTLTGANSEGVYVDEGAGNLISGNTIAGAGDYGIYLDYAAGTSVTGNVIGNTGVGGGNDYGIYAEYDNGDSISSNYIRHSSSYGVEDDDSNFQTYSGNVITGNADDGLYFYGDAEGMATLTNNASRSNGSYGFDLYYAYPNAYTAPWTSVSGNIANYNGSGGFYDEDSYNALWKSNSASRNSGDGFFFDYGANEVITGNTASYNSSEGFEFDYTYGEYAAASVANNAAKYNGDYGFYVDEYAQVGTGNIGTGNTSGSCYGLSGCS